MLGKLLVISRFNVFKTFKNHSLYQIGKKLLTYGMPNNARVRL